MKTSVQKAEQAYQRKRYRNALRHYRMIPENQRDESIMLNMAHCHKSLRQYEAAEACCLNVLQENPDNAEARVTLLKTYLNRNLLDEAEIEIEALKSINSENVNIYTGMAHIKLRNNEIDSAMKLLQKSLAIDPGDINLYLLMGYAFRMKGDHKKALAEYRKALSINWSFEIFKYACAMFYMVNYRLIILITLISAALGALLGFGWFLYILPIVSVLLGLLALSFKIYFEAALYFLSAVIIFFYLIW
jgi:tetratricopeptide (TPR) repeat protein